MFILTLSSLANETTTNNINECKGNNTILNKDNKCVCVPGFVSDLIIDERGCWQCEEACHHLALCSYPGKCVCHSSLDGDGVLDCSLLAPRRIKLEERTLLTDGGYELVFSYDMIKNIIIKQAYCRVSHNIYNTYEVNDKNITCKIPKDISGEVIIYLSFDGFNWSNESLSVFLPVNTQKNHLGIYFQLSQLLMILISAFTLTNYLSKNMVKTPASFTNEEF